MGDVTVILDAIQRGERQAAEELIPLVCDELRRLAADRMALEKLRFFVGLTHALSAEALGISRQTADHRWAFAKAWLYRTVQEEVG